MWYSLESVFVCRVEDIIDDHPLLERKIYLINVLDNEVPDEKANSMGKQLEHEYLNENGERVTWRMKSILEIQELCEKDIYDGMEVFSRLQTSENTSPDRGN